MLNKETTTVNSAIEKMFSSLPLAITVCDANGIITYMNSASVTLFQKDGGLELLGKSLLDCHPQPALTLLEDMLEKHFSNSYTILKNGRKKLIHQTPLFSNDVFSGLAEISFDVPVQMPHFNRDQPDNEPVADAGPTIQLLRERIETLTESQAASLLKTMEKLSLNQEPATSASATEAWNRLDDEELEELLEL